MSDEPLRYELDESVAMLRLDDGKANALSHAMIDAIHRGLDSAEKEAGAVLLLGRPGRFSAGFDLSAMMGGPDSARALVSAGAELLMRLYESPLPIVAGCTGHALAAGALLLLSSDTRIGAGGEFKIGLNEVSIKMTLPVFGVELARDRLSRRHLQRAVVQAEIYDPASAVDAGYLDRVVAGDELLATARAEAACLAELPRQAFSQTKLRVRGATIEHVRNTLAEDMKSFG